MRTKALSLEATIATTERSRRTWWRRISVGTVKRMANDSRGRTMLCLGDVAPHICIPMTSEDLCILLRSDSGEADAQNDVGQMFFLAKKFSLAHFWLTQAALQDHADAMQWLARCYAGGHGVLKDQNLALMWLAKAAAHGSAIAQKQLQSMTSGPTGSSSVEPQTDPPGTA